ncbi:hypothetical protein ACFQ73_30980 [Amycolatopsis japonica]|uniref:hypothetical protein n=1 Tax=Amycolatopsis japonica TaxID=208439 RepID=UPI00366CEA87
MSADRWGVEIEDDISVEAFGALNDDDDAEHVVVDINDSDDWFVEFTRRSVCFQQAERGGEVVGTLDYADRDEALRARSWKSDG